MLESQIKRQIWRRIKRLQQDGERVYAVPYIPGSMGVGGTPDILACVAGKFVGIEVKRVGEQATPLQLARLDEIRKAGGVAFVAYSAEDAEQLLRSLC